MFKKVIELNEYETHDEVLKEVELQKIASSYGFAPKIIDVSCDTESCEINMEDLGKENTLVEIYGEQAEDVPENIWGQIRAILSILYYRENIEYVDVTPYNFILVDNKVYIIDFGHARKRDNEYEELDEEINYFLEDFLNGVNEWNDEFH